MIGNILIVDDEPSALKLLKDILTADGHVVRPFNNGELALRSVAVEAPELILLDIHMPGMNGFEVCRRIKEDERLKNIPVIFISAASDMEDKVRAFQEGGVDYITKPFQKEEVIARVRTHIALGSTIQNQLRDFAAHLQTVREEEKTSIAREIHDDLGGTLTALKMEANWLVGALSAHKELTPLIEHVESMAQFTDNATNVVRRIITGLRPPILDDFGLPAALEWQAAQFNKRTGIECRVNCVACEGCLKMPDKTQSINLFRIFQEALTNVSRHSGASRVEVEFYYDNEKVSLSIGDNGRGMPEKRTGAAKSYGLLGMTERVEQLGGMIEFGSPPGGGFSVTVKLPLLRQQNAGAPCGGL